jgi:hypothetical protein
MGMAHFQGLFRNRSEPAKDFERDTRHPDGIGDAWPLFRAASQARSQCPWRPDRR